MVRQKKKTFNAKSINNILAKQESSENQKNKRGFDSDKENEDNGEEIRKSEHSRNIADVPRIK